MYKKTYITKKVTAKCFVKSSKYLIILESPSKILYIEKILGQDYQVIATCGHICNIDGLKAIDITNNFQPKYDIISTKKSHVAHLGSIIKQYENNNILVASDDDPEGHKIAYDICQIFNLPLATTKRIIFHEITASALNHAIANPTTVSMDLVKSQQARQIIDILIGFKVTPTLWKYMKSDKTKSLSCGRCQSIALKIIYENYQESKRNETELKYKTVGYFLSHPHTIGFELNYDFIEKADVDNFLVLSKTFNNEFKINEKCLSIKGQPKPFNTASLLQKSELPPKITISLLQQLYQEGFITYPRTESTKYSSEFLSQMIKHIHGKFGKDYVGDLTKITNLNVSLPHEGIRVTDLKVENINGDKKLVNLYKLVYNNTIESCMSESIYDSYRITITAPMSYTYTNILEVPSFLGWKANHDKIKNDSSIINYLKHLKSNSIKYQFIDSNQILGNLHSHLSELGLIKKLEILGIGRPSTFASFGDIIIDRGYVKLQNIEGVSISCSNLKLREHVIEENQLQKVVGSQKNKLVIQEIGIDCIEFILNHFNALFDYDYSSNLELELDKIKEDSSSWFSICNETNNNIDNSITNIKIKNEDSFIIDSSNVLQFTKYGPVVKHINITNDIEYLPVKKEIDMKGLRSIPIQNTIIDEVNPVALSIPSGEKSLTNKTLNIDDLVEYKTSYLGNYQEKPLKLKIGKFGPYLEWNTKNFSIKDIGKELCNIKIDDAIKFIEKDIDQENIRNTKMPEKSKTILRVIDINTSIRKGKFGHYIYHKTVSMKKPRFISVSNFNIDILTCEKKIIYNLMNNNNNNNMMRCFSSGRVK
jgi:DNA topoisomerase-1